MKSGYISLSSFTFIIGEKIQGVKGDLWKVSTISKHSLARNAIDTSPLLVTSSHFYLNLYLIHSICQFLKKCFLTLTKRVILSSDEKSPQSENIPRPTTQLSKTFTRHWTEVHSKHSYTLEVSKSNYLKSSIKLLSQKFHQNLWQMLRICLMCKKEKHKIQTLL